MSYQLTDSYGRTINNLRISVTDQCNFRCIYCMPEEGMIFQPRNEILTFDEITRLVQIVNELGISKLRLTGGEPTIRKDLPVLVRMLSDLPEVQDLAMTTNGFLLKKMSRDLYEAGLPRINVSLDTIDEEKFRKMTRRDVLQTVLDGLEEATRYFELPIKINVVAMKGYTEDEIIHFARMARTGPYQGRFIEFMPLDSGRAWQKDHVVSGAEILERLRARFDLHPSGRKHPSATAKCWRFVDGSAEIGLITPVTEPFCENCNRLRLTADGKIRTCLFSHHEYDLKPLLRGDASDADLAKWLAEVVLKKEERHNIGETDFEQPNRTMSSIGG